MRKTPQCDRFLEVREQSQVIGEFLDWVADQHGARLRVDDHPSPRPQHGATLGRVLRDRPRRPRPRKIPGAGEPQKNKTEEQLRKISGISL